jgi:hypothetical protein
MKEDEKNQKDTIFMLKKLKEINEKIIENTSQLVQEFQDLFQKSPFLFIFFKFDVLLMNLIISKLHKKYQNETLKLQKEEIHLLCAEIEYV